MSAPQFPVHGQSIERILKEAIRVSKTVFGFEPRDGYKRTTMDHRDILALSHLRKVLLDLLN